MTDALIRTDDPVLQLVLDRQNIIETVTRVAVHADAHEWELLRACFTDEVKVDYTSLTGGEPSRVGADDLITSWSETLVGFDATQHQVTNFLVTLYGDEARCQAYVRAYHYLKDAPGGDSWLVAGTYDYGLVRVDKGWRVEATKLILTRLEGNMSLVDAARAHARAKAAVKEL